MKTLKSYWKYVLPRKGRKIGGKHYEARCCGHSSPLLLGMWASEMPRRESRLLLSGVHMKMRLRGSLALTDRGGSSHCRGHWSSRANELISTFKTVPSFWWNHSNWRSISLGFSVIILQKKMSKYFGDSNPIALKKYFHLSKEIWCDCVQARAAIRIVSSWSSVAQDQGGNHDVQNGAMRSKVAVVRK